MNTVSTGGLTVRGRTSHKKQPERSDLAQLGHHQEALIILDYGSQYTQLIARKARELGVYSIILPFRATAEEIAAHDPKGIVLSGGPNSVYEKDAPGLNPDVFGLEIPLLGVCYGMQLLALNLGGKVEPGTTREYGNATISLAGKSSLIDAKADGSTVWMSHGDHVASVPDGFVVTAKSGDIICAMEDSALGLYGLQFHPEVAHSLEGKNILGRFFDLCGFHRDCCLLYTSDAADERSSVDLGGRRIIKKKTRKTIGSSLRHVNKNHTLICQLLQSKYSVSATQNIQARTALTIVLHDYKRRRLD